MLLAFDTLYKGSITLYKRGEEKEGKRERKKEKKRERKRESLN